LAVASGGLAIFIQIKKDISAAEAREAEALVKAENRRLQMRTVALGMVNLAGLDLGKPLHSATFQFEVGREVKHPMGPIQFPGFIGPFPALGKGTAQLYLRVPEMFDLRFDLKAEGENGLRIGPADTPEHSGVVLRPSDSGEYLFLPLGGEDRLGWAAGGEDMGFSYDLDIKSDMPTRAVIARLAEATAFGTLVVKIPGLTEAQERRIARGYEQIAPSLVLLPPQMEPDVDGFCITRIRVPMKVRQLPDNGPDLMVFEFTASPQGFDNEICGWTP
jgi:hypothetical protein